MLACSDVFADGACGAAPRLILMDRHRVPTSLGTQQLTCLRRPRPCLVQHLLKHVCRRAVRCCWGGCGLLRGGDLLQEVL